jgi:hypothetical protein
MYRRDATQIRTMKRNGTDVQWLGAIGHVLGPVYSYTYPGGPNQMSATLQIPPVSRPSALDPGRITELVRGGTVIWEGRLDEPSVSQDGWGLGAHGSGTYPSQFAARYSNYTADEVINNAIAEGMRWVNPGVGVTVYDGNQQESGSVLLDTTLEYMTKYAGLGWSVGKRNVVTMGPLPTVCNRILVSAEPAARNIFGFYNKIWIRYKITDDNTDASTTATYGLTSVVNQKSIDEHDVMTAFLDLTGDGVMTQAAAQAVGNSILRRYDDAAFSGSFSIRFGQLLTMGGTPVDLGSERAGFRARLVLSSGAYGGSVMPLPSVEFTCGEYEFDDPAGTATVTPLQVVESDLSGMLSEYSQQHSVTSS